ncbi:ATP-binding protein [Streptomyces sp. NPDC003036]|uniref:ATP-binding protein n=1 Tax=Streptomyces sp. NPDC003036 TaxID=3154442 RepID=UPI0033AAB512
MTTTRRTTQFLAALVHGVEVERTAIRFTNSEQAVPQSRRFLRAQLSARGFTPEDELTDRVLLVASELVTNSVLHGRTRAMHEPEMIGLALSVKPGEVLGILVTDNSPDPPVQIIRPAAVEDGQGLRLVSAMADHWTAAPATHNGEVVGKGVWAFFVWPGESNREPPALHHRTPMEVW